MRNKIINGTVITEAYQEVTKLKLDRNLTLAENMNMFYDLMRKYGIRHGTPSFDGDGNKIGTICSTPEWNMLYNAFKSNVEFFFTFEHHLHLPSDLHCYEGGPEDFTED